MEAFRAAIAANVDISLALGGLLIGFVFGWVVYRTNFCTMGSVSDFLTLGDYRRFRAWVLAAAVALLGAQLLDHWRVVELSRSMYLSPNFNWLGSLVGGLMFGFGMVLAGGCASRNLARAGGGDLRALLVLIVVGIFAYMTIGGLIAPVRDWLERATQVDLAGLGYETQSFAAIIGKLAGAPGAELLIGALVLAAALIYCFTDAAFRVSPVHIVSGIAVGLCVVAGWALTGLAFDELAEKSTNPISLTFVRPAGDTMEWLQRFTAIPVPGFGVATVIGSLLGAFLAATSLGRFRLATFSDVNETVRSLCGAALMGTGGVLALGCTVGQGITGVSTLALGSLLAFPAIVLGAILGVRYLERLIMSEA